MRRLYYRLFHPVRRERKQSILQDFEKDLVEVNPRLLQRRFKTKLAWKASAVFAAFLIIGTLGPNYFGFGHGHDFDPAYVSADFEEDYADAMLLTLDEGFLAKTYLPTESSKNIKGVFTHEVRQGDTISGIARLYGVNPTDIILNNDLSPYDITRLKVNQKLSIARGVIHKVKKDESVSKLAKKYEVEEEKILAANDLVDDLRIGQLVVVPDGKRATPTYSLSTSDSLAYRSIIAEDVGGKLLFPTVGKITQSFKRGHYALDIANTQSPPIYAAAAGKVVKAQCGWNGGYGCHIIIDHGNGLKTLYAHNRKLDVTVGEQVARGQIIAQMGNTGRVYGKTGIHVHFEVIRGGQKVNPMAYLF
jgi:murein DD-endopeptidase MepM/ murein hydrolase activator NlpD